MENITKKSSKKLFDLDKDEIYFDLSNCLKGKVNIEQQLKLKNVTEKTIIVKVKTNQIKMYLIKPSCCIIQANQEIELKIFFTYNNFENIKEEELYMHKFKFLCFLLENDINVNENPSVLYNNLKTNNINTPKETKKILVKFTFPNFSQIKSELSKQKMSLKDEKINSGTFLEKEYREMKDEYDCLVKELELLNNKLNEIRVMSTHGNNSLAYQRAQMHIDKVENIQNIPGEFIIICSVISFIIGFYLTA